ncbi:carbohydrate binding domain-containing protein [Streptomyces xanthophaeus]|uniref:carbohydrate binding domain-containing protein n=1 Tax=Streptomyces xanthophaeus TaxID=67385 RepID=UPI0039901093
MATPETWTDISQWVDLATGIRITRGASDELAQTQPSTMSLALDNSDGRFTSGLSTSPYYPYVRPNCLVQLGLVTVSRNFARSPTFESGVTDGWAAKSGQAPAAIVASTVRAHQGTYSLRVDWATTGTGGVLEQVVYGLDIGRTYTVSGWVWVPTGDPAVRWRIDDAAPGTASSTTNAWQQISKTFTATSTSHTVQLTTSVTSPVAGDQVWLDEVQVEDGASATAFDADGAQLHWRFYGLANNWGTEWEGLQSQVTLTATDLFKALQKAPLPPVLTEEVQSAGPVVYYPLTEPSTSSSAGDMAGRGAGSLVQAQVGSGGSVTFAATAGPPATGQSVVRFSPASASDGIRLDAHMGDFVVEQTSADWITYEVWFQTTTADRQFFSLRSIDFAFQIDFTLNASGYLSINTVSTGGPLTPTVINATNLADGAWHHMVWTEDASEVYIDGGSAISAPGPATMYALRYMTIGGNTGALWDGAVAHAALYVGPVDVAALVGHYDAGALGYAGEDSDQRILRLGGYAGITSVVGQGAFFPVASQGAGGSNILEMMRAVETTEGGWLASRRDDHGLLFQSRSVRNAPVAALSLNYAELETDSVRMPDDDQKIVNQYTGMRPGGATQRVVDASSVAAFGVAPREDNILAMTDLDVIDALNWVVSRYAVPEQELRELPIQAYAQPLATYRILLDADISTAFTVTSLPAQAPASALTVFIEGYTEEIGQESHQLQFHTSRAQISTVWILGDSTYGVLGSTTRLGY